MHIPENYLSPSTCAVAIAVMVPIWGICIHKVSKQIKTNRSLVTEMGIGAAFAFLIMMFNVPVPGGTTGHAVGSALLAILLGPYAACLSVSMALLLQSTLFGDGGILCIGANSFNMAVVLPFVGYGIFLLCKKIWKKNGGYVGAFLGGYFGIVLAALCAGIELGIQPLLFKNAAGEPMYCPYPLYISVPAMVVAHLVIGFIEGGITLAVYAYIRRVAPQTIYNPRGEQINAAEKTKERRTWTTVMYYILGIAVILSPIGLLASATAWGEWGSDEVVEWLKYYGLNPVIPESFNHNSYHAAFADYTIPGMDSGWQAAIGYILCGITAVVIFVLLGKIITALINIRKPKLATAGAGAAGVADATAHTSTEKSASDSTSQKTADPAAKISNSFLDSNSQKEDDKKN